MAPGGLGRPVLAVLVLVTAAACKADVSVTVEARADGGGVVRAKALLDREAAEALGDLESQLALDDLRVAGWEINGPAKDHTGGVEIEVRHRFGHVEEGRRLLGQMTGSDGPLKGFTITQNRSFLRTETEVRGTVDLTGGLESFSDPKLTAALGGKPLGITPEQLEQRLGRPAEQAIGLQFAARLPGRVQSNAPAVAGGTAVWAPQLGEQVVIEATAVKTNLINIVLVVVAVLSTALLIVVGARRRPRRRA